METAPTPRTIKVIASDGREEVVSVAAGPNAHTRAHVTLKMRLRGQSVTYQELVGGTWVPLAE